MLSDMSQAASDLALSEAMILILVEREERLGRPRPRESRLDRAEEGTSANKESLLSEGSANLKGEDSLVGEVRYLVGEAGPGDLKHKILTWGAGPDLEMEWWRSGESLTGVA